MAVLSPNMNLPIPTVGVDPAPQWALYIDQCLTLVDQHNHAPGNGVQVQPNGLNISSDLTFQGNNATNLRTARLLTQLSTPSGALDLTCLYSYGTPGNLFYTDASGNHIQITSGGAVVGSPGSITNLAPPASVTYVSATPAYVFQSNVNTPANLDGGSLVLRDISANSFGVTLNPPPSIAANYSITLPAALPGSASFVTLDNSGNLAATIPTAGGITGNNIVTNVVLNGTLTIGGSGGPILSNSSGSLVVDAFGFNMDLEGTLRFTNGSLPVTITPISAGSAGALYFSVNDAAPRLPMMLSGVDEGYSTRGIYGTVASNGTKVSGQGFTCSNTGTGTYLVSFSLAFNDHPAVVVSANTTLGSSIDAHVTSVNSSTFTVETYTTVSNASTNSDWSFVVMGRAF